MKNIEKLWYALRDLVGETGIHEDDCECDNTHEANNTVCSYCYARNVLNETKPNASVQS